LARKVRASLTEANGKWEIDADEDGRPRLTSGRFGIVLAPRAVRLFDAIHLYCEGAEIWLPFIARLRLRAAARYRLIRAADAQWSEMEQRASRGKPRR
jgi:hypothetical protein